MEKFLEYVITHIWVMIQDSYYLIVDGEQLSTTFLQ